jgi:hypothetical protein
MTLLRSKPSFRIRCVFLFIRTLISGIQVKQIGFFIPSQIPGIMLAKNI